MFVTQRDNIAYFAYGSLLLKCMFNCHDTFSIKTTPVIIHRLTAKFFAHCPSHPNPLVNQIGNYTLGNLINMYNKYKHILQHSVVISSPIVAEFFLYIFTAVIYIHFYLTFAFVYLLVQIG